MELKKSKIVLVGRCNGNVRMQAVLGVVCFCENEDGKLRPCLYMTSFPAEEGSDEDSFKSEIKSVNRDKYELSFPCVADSFGLTLFLDKEHSDYRFIVGTEQGVDPSGTVSNGGPELVDALIELELFK